MSNDIMKLIDKKMRLVESDLEKISETAMVDLVENELKTATVSNLYATPESDWYNRTGGAYDSITGFVNKNKNCIDIYAIMDLDNISNHHYSIITGENVDGYLDQLLEYGNNPNNKNPIIEYDGMFMFRDAQQKINKKSKKLLKSKLKSLGYKVKG